MDADAEKQVKQPEVIKVPIPEGDHNLEVEVLKEMSKPTAADLDAVAAEEVAKAATQGAPLDICSCQASYLPHRHTSEGVTDAV